MLRRFHTLAHRLARFNPDPNYQLKCGLEIHTQLQTKYKLFSLSPTSYNAWPNSNVSYFDAGLPGTQPKLNPEALYLALKTAAALNCDIQEKSSFDRKHYFYPDQPLGYQITQHYRPLAKNGQIELSSQFDQVSETKTIRLEQIQIEQDTGKTNNNEFDHTIKIDLNRSNTPLIELVTKPDFDTIDQVKAFVKKYVTLVRHLGVCSGDLETGAVRVDVNVSVNGHPRVELKNLNSNTEIQLAIKYEYQRQMELIKTGDTVVQETRGWTGTKTVSLRKKENAVDYRYFPDLELPHVLVSKTIGDEIRSTLPELPEEILQKLTTSPHNLELKYARHFVETPELLAYYYRVFDLVDNAKVANNWVTQEVPAAFSKMDKSHDYELLSPTVVAEIIQLVQSNKFSLTSARHLLYNIIQHNDTGTIPDLIEKYDLASPDELVSSEDIDEAITEMCQEIIAAHPDVVAKIRKGQQKLMKFLVGQGMRETQGKVSAATFEKKLSSLIN